MRDIVERLRNHFCPEDSGIYSGDDIVLEAADEIDRLRTERDFQEMGWRNQTAVAERLRALIEEVLDKEMSAHEWKIWAATANGILSEMRHEKTISDEDLNAVLEVEPGTGGE